MIKKIFYTILFISGLYANLIDGIAILVNDTPITLYDIDKKMQTEHITKEQAIAILIDKILYKQELKKYNINVDIFDIDDYIEKLAKQNHMSVLDFKSVIRQQQNYDLFVEQIKKQLLHQKLIKRIATGKIKIATPEDIEIFYKNNQEQFKVANSFDVIMYSSTNKRFLKELQQNPMLQNPNIEMKTLALTTKDLNSQTKYILNTTKERSFSVIFAQNRKFNMFFVQAKKNIKTMPLDSVKNMIFNQIMKQREQQYLKDYFETLKITAKIKVIR